MRRETNTRIRQHHWVKLVNEKIHRGQRGNVLTFFFSRKQSREVENSLKACFSLGEFARCEAKKRIQRRDCFAR